MIKLNRQLIDKHIILLLVFILLSCNDENSNSSLKEIHVLDANNAPIAQVEIQINQNSYFTNGNGKAIISLDEASEKSINLKINKKGYQNISINVPSFFIGNNDIYTLKKVSIIPNRQIAVAQKVTITEVKPEVKKEKPVKKVTEQITATKKNELKKDLDNKKLFQKAEFYKNKNEITKSIETFKEIRNDDIDLYTKANFEMGVMNQAKLKRFGEAIKNYSAALKTNNSKNFAEIYYNRAMCYYNLGKWNNAISDFKKSFSYISYLTGNPSEKKEKYHNLYYFWADALVRRANLETQQSRKKEYYALAIDKIKDYLDRFEGYKSDKTKIMKSDLKSFINKLNRM